MNFKNTMASIIICFLTIGCETSSLFEPLSEDYYFCEPTTYNLETGDYISGDYIDYNCNEEYDVYDYECRQCKNENSEFYKEFHLGGCAWELYAEREYGVVVLGNLILSIGKCVKIKKNCCPASCKRVNL